MNWWIPLVRLFLIGWIGLGLALPATAADIDPVNAPKTAALREIVFIDAAVQDARVLADGVRPGLEVVRLKAGGDGMAQIGAVLADRRDLKAIHIVSHGEPGMVFLGAGLLSTERLEGYDPQMKIIGRSLQKGGNILLYGCSVARGPLGQRFIAKLATATGAAVAASVDATGSAGHHGNWVLEQQSGAIDTPVAFTAKAQTAYPHVLSTFDFSSFSGDNKQTVDGVTVTVATDSGGSLSASSGYVVDTSNSGTYIRFTFSQPVNISSFNVGFASNSGAVSAFTIQGSNGATTYTYSATPGYSDLYSGGAPTYTVTPSGWGPVTSVKVARTGGSGTVTFTADTIVFTAADIAPSLSATGGTPTFVQGSTTGADLYGTVAANTNNVPQAQTFTGATFTVTNVADATEYLTIGGTAIPLTAGSGTIGSGGNYTVSLSGGTATVTLTNLGRDNSGMAALVNEAAYKNTAAAVTTGDRVVTLVNVTDSGSTSNSTTVSLAATVTVSTGTIGSALYTFDTNTSGTAFADGTISGYDTGTTGNPIIYTLNGHVSPLQITLAPSDSKAGSSQNLIGDVWGDGGDALSADPSATAPTEIKFAFANSATFDFQSITIGNNDNAYSGGTLTLTFTTDKGQWTATSPLGSYMMSEPNFSNTYNIGDELASDIFAGVKWVTITAASGTLDFNINTLVINNITPPNLPAVTAISPANGPVSGGTAVTITGTKFTGATSVRFGGVAAGSFSVDSATQITATSPAGSAGAVHITVTTPNGTSATSSADQFTYAAVPTVTAVSPTSGPTAGGTSVTITGTNLTGATSVMFGTTAATGITVNSATQITATAPAGSLGTVDVTVTTAGGTSVTSSSDQFIYKASQTITFNNPGDQNFGTTPPLNATASSGLTVTFSSSTTGVCTVTTGGALTFPATGTCTINANQTGDGTYNAATTVTRSFAVNAVVPGAPAIGSATAGNTQATIAFTGPAFTGGAAITGYTVTSNPGNLTATALGSPITVTGLANGTAYTFTVTATNSAGTGPASAPSTSFTPKGIQTITFANPGAQNFGTTPTLSATVSSGLAPTFTSSTTGVCTITPVGVLTFLTTGTCTINAAQAGNAAYNAATTVSRSFSVNAVVPGAPIMGSASAGDAQASVTFTAPAFTGGSAVTSYTVTTNPGGLTATGTASPITVTGLTNGTAYTFTVTATNNVGTGAASAASSSVTPNPGPAVASVAVPANGTYKIGDNLDFTIIWDSVATVTGTPRMALVIGSSTVYATYMSGSGTTATLFRYTVTAGQSDSDGITVGALTLNGGTIRNSANSNATLTLTGVGNTSGVLVDTTAPTLPAVNIVVNNQSDPHKIVLTFNKALNATTIGAASAWAAAANGGAPIYAIAGAALTAANQVTLTLAAVDITTAATFITDSAANAHLRITPPATLADSVGNTYAAGQVTESGAAHILDTTPPVLASVGIGAATSTGGTMTAIASEKAKGYWIAVAGGATAPAVAQVKAGVAYGGVTVVADGTGALPAGSAGSIALNGLAPSTVYDIYLVAEDAAGNATAAVAKAVITTGAALKVSTLPDGAVTTDTTLNVSGTAGTPANLKSLTINGTSVAVAADGSFSYPVQLLAGANAITVVATDISGTIATDSRTITLDSSALHLAVAYPPDNKALIQQSVTVTGSIAELLASGTAKIAAKAEAATAADPTMVVSYSINDGTPGTATLTDGTYSFTVDLTSGMNTIQISAANGAGKTAQAKRTVTYQPAFSLTVSDPASDIRTPQTSYLLQGIVADNSAPVTVTITMDGQTYTPTVDSTTGAFQQQLTFSGSKVYQVSVTATDGSATLSVPRNIITVAGAGSAFTIVDALTALKASVGLVTPDQSQILRLDVAPMVSGVSVGDGMVDMEDVIIVLRKAVGLL